MRQNLDYNDILVVCYKLYLYCVLKVELMVTECTL